MDSLIDPKTVIHTAKIVSSSSAFFLAGYCLSFSQNTFPSLYEHRPQFSAVAFRQISHNAGIVPALTLVSTSSFAYLAYAAPEQRNEWTKAAVSMFLTVPWTWLVMHKGINRLQEIGQDAAKIRKSEQNLEHRQLLVRWVKQNYVAVALQFTSAVIGVRAILGA